MCTENTFADLFCVQALKRHIFSEFSVYIRKVLSIEHVDFIRIFLLYSQKRNDGQNLVPKMGIYLHLRKCPVLEFLRTYADHPMPKFLRPYADTPIMDEILPAVTDNCPS